VALGVVVVGALVVGARTGGGPPDARHRIAALESSVRCPSCEDLSVADSSAPSAVELRSLIAADVHAGRSDAQIRQFLVARYGPTILLSPSTSGAVGIVWLAPLVVLGLGLVGLGVLFWRRRRATPAHVDVSDAERQLVEEALAARSAAGGERGSS
jgi:cytochrome c-type biogenesis protein CcmH